MKSTDHFAQEYSYSFIAFQNNLVFRHDFKIKSDISTVRSMKKWSKTEFEPILFLSFIFYFEPQKKQDLEIYTENVLNKGTKTSNFTDYLWMIFNFSCSWEIVLFYLNGLW